MKNVFLLPTDKPSRLFENVNCGLSLNDELEPNGIMCQNQNIYITSSEEIKEGDWVYDKVLNIVFQTDKHINFAYANLTNNVLKIILTTDQDLIKDGVQAIDDEFLEWYVENPSCEEIEIKKEYITPLGDIVETCYDNERLNYKIKIPKEEQKQHLINMMKADEELGLYEEPKKETIEEVAERFSIDIREENYKDGFIDGAKWQQEKTTVTLDDAYSEGFENGKNYQAERMYSEEEVLDLLCARNIEFNLYEGRDKVEQWFEQFKK